ncbi:avidin/streptavidin family protein [Paraburkholderia sediminicola]|uniref:avidin/streptavidin family protein n=1 Tax=Paraburkholderia sediminicola TaxID=458836 RepID=UPI0038BCC715
MNMNLVGKWGNQYGSVLEIHDCDADGSFRGIYRSDTGASGIYPMNGYAHGGTGASQPISLSVFWRPTDSQVFDPSWHWMSVMTGTLFLDEPITGQQQLLHGLVASSLHEAVDIYGPGIYTESLTFSPLSERLPGGQSFAFGTAENKVSVEWLNACPDSPFRALSYTYDDAGLVTGALTQQDLTSVRVQGFTDPNPRERLQSIALTALVTDRNGRACAIGMGGFIDRQSNTAKIERFSSSAVSYTNRYSGVAVTHERFAVTSSLL